jgi:hypothetical protein
MAHAPDTLYEQTIRGQAAQAAGCFERKMLNDPNPKEEIALAMLTRSLVVAKTTAESQRDALKSYTEDNIVTASEDTSAIDKEITSALSRKKSKNDGDGKQSIIDECIPCLDRTLDVDLLAPLEDLLDDFENDLLDRWNTLRSIWELLNSDDFYADICDLMDFFSFQCLPDLVAILSMLLWLWKSLLESFSIDINGSLWSLIGMLMGPFLAGLESVIQQYIDMIMAPIDCIISSLLFQMSKIPQFEQDSKWLDERQAEQRRLEERELQGEIGGEVDNATVMINAAIQSQLSFTALKATSWDQSKEYYQTQAAKNDLEKYQYGQQHGEGPVGRTTPITVEDTETIAAETGGDPGSIEEQARLEREAYIKEREARERSRATTADWLLDAANTLESGLGQVGSYLIAGRDRMNSWLASIRDDLRAFLFGSGTGFTNAVSLTTTISRLARLIGFVKALIKMAEDGFDCGTDNNLSEPNMINFLQNYYAPESGAAVIVGDNGEVTILPPGTGDTRIAAITLPKSATAAAQAGTGVTISIPNCLNRTDETDLRKIEEWIKQISQ